MLYTPLYTTDIKSGIEWMNIIASDFNTCAKIQKGHLFGEFNPVLRSPQNPSYIDFNNCVIRIKDFYIERDNHIYMGYEWLNTQFAEKVYEKWYKNPNSYQFVPRISKVHRSIWKSSILITVDLFTIPHLI